MASSRATSIICLESEHLTVVYIGFKALSARLGTYLEPFALCFGPLLRLIHCGTILDISKKGGRVTHTFMFHRRGLPLYSLIASFG